jgi:hypothetical protein
MRHLQQPDRQGVRELVQEFGRMSRYKSVADLRDSYPDFFWKTVRPYIGEALHYLRITQEGKQWVANLYANLFSMEHRALAL